MTSYERLHNHFRKLSRLGHLDAICSWDQAAMMPPGGNKARGEAMAELAVLIHELATAPHLAELFGAAQEENLSPQQRISLQTMQRRWRQATLLPGRLVEAKSLAASTCEHAWREQRKNNDWQRRKLTKRKAHIRCRAYVLHTYTEAAA